MASDRGSAVATRDGETKSYEDVFYACKRMEDLFTMFLCRLLYTTAQLFPSRHTYKDKSLIWNPW